MKSFEIHYSDLTEEAQQRYLKFQQVDSEAELNTDLAPLATVESIQLGVELKVKDKHLPLDEGDRYFAIEKADDGIYDISESFVDEGSIGENAYADLDNAIKYCTDNNLPYNIIRI